MKANEVLREFVNDNLGSELTTGFISRNSGVHLRVVQQFCKKIRETTRKAKYTKQGGTIVYKFKRLSKQDIG